MNKLDVLKQTENISVAIEDHLNERNEEVRIQKLARLMYGTLATILKEDVFHSHKLASEIVNGFDMSMLKVSEKIIDIEVAYIIEGPDGVLGEGWVITIKRNTSDFNAFQFMKSIASFLIKFAFKRLTHQNVLSVNIL